MLEFRQFLRSLKDKYIFGKYSSGIIKPGDSYEPEYDNGGFWKRRLPPTQSLLQAARIFNENKGETIVEIGTGIHGFMSGDSCKIWSKKTNAKRIIAVDLDYRRTEEVRKALSNEKRLKTFVTDGISFLRSYKGIIDLLYLDFWCDDGQTRANSYLEAYESAKRHFRKNSMILIDDTDHLHPWKHTLIVPEAEKDGFKLIWEGRQTLLKME